MRNSAEVGVEAPRPHRRVAAGGPRSQRSSSPRRCSLGRRLPEPSQLLQRAAAAATEAGCGEVATTPDYRSRRQGSRTHRPHRRPTAVHVPDHAAGIRSARRHPPGPLPAGVYDFTLEEVYRAIHSLEHGASIVWYDPTAPVGTVARLREFYDRRLQDAQVGQDRAIVAPYDIPGDAAGILPEGTEMALVSWHRLRSCASIDLAVAFDFTSQYSFPTAEDRSTRASRPNPGLARRSRGSDGQEEEATAVSSLGTPAGSARRRQPRAARPQGEARRLREAERRRARRAASLRRTLTSAGIAVAAVAAISLFRSFQGPNEIPEGAVQAASEAGCTIPQHRPDLTPSQRHLTRGETITYPDPPATSGKHNGSQPPDDPKVDAPFEETLAVHALEHGGGVRVLPPGGRRGLPQAVVDRLAYRLPEQRDVPRPVPDPHAGDGPHPDGMELPTVPPRLGRRNRTHPGGRRHDRERVRHRVRVHGRGTRERDLPVLNLSRR